MQSHATTTYLLPNISSLPIMNAKVSLTKKKIHKTGMESKICHSLPVYHVLGICPFSCFEISDIYIMSTVVERKQRRHIKGMIELTRLGSNLH